MPYRIDTYTDENVFSNTFGDTYTQTVWDSSCGSVVTGDEAFSARLFYASGNSLAIYVYDDSTAILTVDDEVIGEGEGRFSFTTNGKEQVIKVYTDTGFIEGSDLEMGVVLETQPSSSNNYYYIDKFWGRSSYSTSSSSIPRMNVGIRSNTFGSSASWQIPVVNNVRFYGNGGHSFYYWEGGYSYNHKNTKEIISGGESHITGSMESFFYGCTYLEHLDLDGWSFADVTSFTDCFYNCSALTSITGDFSDITKSISFGNSPLDLDSARRVINALNEVTKGQTLTLSQTTYDLLEDSDLENATEKGWTVVRYN